ncbi:MAG: hypothetical protein ACI9XP_001503 [Lentimonas sp.]
MEPAHPKVSRFSSGRVYQFGLISFFSRLTQIYA